MNPFISRMSAVLNNFAQVKTAEQAHARLESAIKARQDALTRCEECMEEAERLKEEIPLEHRPFFHVLDATTPATDHAISTSTAEPTEASNTDDGLNMGMMEGADEILPEAVAVRERAEQLKEDMMDVDKQIMDLKIESDVVLAKLKYLGALKHVEAMLNRYDVANMELSVARKRVEWMKLE